MFDVFSILPERASTAAARVDALLWFLISVSTVMTVLIFGLIFYFCVKYRRRAEYVRTPHIEGSWKLETFWSVTPLMIMMIMFVWGAEVYLYIVRPPAGGMPVYVVGKQWMWKIQHAEGQREINTLHVPVNQPVRLTLISEDVIHSFWVPAFRIKVDVLPGRYVHSWFQATKIGQYNLFCAQYCGTDHSGMIGKIIVMSPEDYQQWLSEHAEGSMALEGRKIFLKYQCVSCHSREAPAPCPILENLYNQEVSLTDGRTVIADDSYIRESIVEPDAKIVAGYEPIMPSFAGQITEEEMLQLVAYIRSLGPGETPDRVDAAPRPVADSPAKPTAPSEPQSKDGESAPSAAAGAKAEPGDPAPASPAQGESRAGASPRAQDKPEPNAPASPEGQP